MQRRIAVTLFFGILAGIIPLLPRATPMFGIWLSTLALLFLGLSEGLRAATNAGTIAVIVVLLLSSGYEACNTAVLIVMPSCLLVNRLLLHKVDGQGNTVWYPAIRAFAELTLVPAGFFMAFTLVVNSGKNPPLSEMITNGLTVDISGLDARAAEFWHSYISQWGFVVIAFAAWFWVLSTWLLAVLANRKLAGKKDALRPSLALTPRGLPVWLPVLLALFVGLAFSPQANDAFTGKTIVFILLLPYVVSGMAIIHAISKGWHTPVLWLAMIYILLIFQPWTAIFVAAAGLYFHIAEMLDKRGKVR